MWLIAARDLQYRRRRFLIAIAATGLVFGIALLLDGASKNITDETTHIVGLFRADGFVVDRRATGPFTTTVVIPDDALPPTGPGRADPFLVSRATVRAGKLVDVNLVGYRPGGLGTPPVDEGRAVRRTGEVVADSSLDVGVGDRLRVGELNLRVVGKSSGIRFNFGTPSVFVALRDAQRVVLGGQHLAMAYAVRAPRRVLVAPAGLRVVSNAQARDDLHRTTKSGSDTVSFLNVLLWIVAAGIVASIVYLNALERTRDFAVLKATGSSNRSIVGGLAVQATVLTLLAAILAVGIAFALKPGFPFPVTLSGGSVAKIVVVAVAVGLVASLVGVRRAVTTDPAIAIGGA